MGALMTRVQHVTDLGDPRGVDGRGVQGDGVGAPIVRRDEEQPIGTFERRRETRRVRVVAATNRDSALGESPGARGIADDESEVRGADGLQQVVDRPAVQAPFAPVMVIIVMLLLLSTETVRS